MRKITIDEAEELLEYIAFYVHELNIETMPSVKGHFRRGSLLRAVNIASNLDAILFLRDPKQLAEYGYNKKKYRS